MLKVLFSLILAFGLVLVAWALDVNKASDEQLQSIKGVGPALAKEIVSQRKIKTFVDWDDFIERVKGVGDKKAQTLSAAGLTIGTKAYTQPAANATKAKNNSTKAKP